MYTCGLTVVVKRICYVMLETTIIVTSLSVSSAYLTPLSLKLQRANCTNIDTTLLRNNSPYEALLCISLCLSVRPSFRTGFCRVRQKSQCTSRRIISHNFGSRKKSKSMITKCSYSAIRSNGIRFRRKYIVHED